MAFEKISALIFVIVCVLAGLCHGDDKDCNTDKAQVFAKMVTCVTKDHPEYFLTVLTKMDRPTSMESPDFMCDNEGMMSELVQCFLNYVEGCMPSQVASEVATVMPSKQTIKRGVRFLCQHRKDFEHPCVMNQLSNLVECISNKMETFSQVTRYPHTNMQEALCTALRVEERCLATNLVGCPASVMSNIMSGLMAFFPTENCPTNKPLKFISEVKR